MKVRYISSKGYHLRTVTDAFDTFENRETTVSHAFRERHPFLLNRSFGEAFFHAVRTHVRARRFGSVLEIGGGQGGFARGFIGAWAKSTHAPPKTYRIVDLSGVLLQTQKQLLRRSPAMLHLIQADAECLPLKGASFNGVIVANEMIADLDSWKLVRQDSGKAKKNEAGEVQCIGRKCEHFSPELVRKYLRRYQISSFRHRSTIFPIGFVLLLEDLYRVIGEPTGVVITEYFDLKGGGSVIRFYKHSECSLNLDLVCHLAREVGFSLRVMSLVDFLDLHITAPVPTRSLLEFARDKLGYNLSTTSPYESKRLRRLMKTEHQGSCDNFLSRAELQKFVSGFYVLILQKESRLSAADFQSQLIVKRDANVVKMRSRKGESYLVTSHPFTFRKLNQSGEQIWSRIDGKRTIGDIAGYLARYWGISRRRALADTRSFVRTLHRQHCVW